MPKIDRLWVYVQEDTGPNDEGMVTAMGHVLGMGHMPMPLMGSDDARIESIRPVAQSVADATGKPIKLIFFSVRTEIETLVPHGGERNGH